MPRRSYLEAIADHVVVFDGANGTQLQKYPLTAEDFGGEQYVGCFDYLAITRPDMLAEVHSGYFAAGSEVVETNTFRSNRITLAEYGLQDRVLEINRAAARIARQVADRFERETGIPRYVAGSIGPTGKLPSSTDPELSNITFKELEEVYREQAQGLVEGGVDLLLVETSQDILEVKAAVAGIHRYFQESGRRVPLQVQVTLDTSGRMLLGTDIAAALTTLVYLPIDVIGINCSTGPEYMREPVRYLVEHSPRPISVLPNAGLPLNVDGEAVYPLQPDPFAEMMAEFVAWGVEVVGGCCGTTPAHIERLIEVISPQRYRQEQARRPGAIRAGRRRTYIPTVSSGMRAVPLRQEPPPLLVGERINAQGSRKAKRLLLAGDYDAILELAQEQMAYGAHVLDVCVAMTEREDEAEMMRTVVKKLSTSVEAPLMFDSTEPAVIEAALETYPGRGIINSIHLEGGRDRLDAVLPLAVKHGAAVVALTIDEQGMARTAERKLEVARRIYQIAVEEYGLLPDALIFDPLTFTLATGDPEYANAAVETLEGLRRIKAELPGVLTNLGVSNVSFGLRPAARRVLNSVFLYHAVEAGLDVAIVNPRHTTPYSEIPEEQRTLADDLIFNRRPDALSRFIQYFEEHEVTLEEAERVDPTAGMTPEEKLYWQIVHRRKEGIEALVDEVVAAHDPIWTLNQVLLPAMKEVGDRFGAGELILPFVLQSAEVMKKAVARLETYLERAEGASKGQIILATVYGDVHDIGKNLVKTILVNNGYIVHDLGKQVPANVIIDKAVEVQADAIGLSALLVSTSRQMPLVVNELARRGLEIPVLIGGAAINRRFGRRILFLEEDGRPYPAGVFYCKDAFEGLAVMDRLVDPEQREALVAQVIAEAEAEVRRRSAPTAAAPGPAEAGPRSVPPPPRIPEPPFWGPRVVREIPLQAVFPYIHKPELFRLSWGGKNTRGEAWERLEAEFEARLARMQREALQEGYLRPQAVYGYFPCQSEGDDLVLYDWRELAAQREIARFTFPRQPSGDRLCLADYFAPVGSPQVDVVALQVVTVGPGATEKFDALQAAGDYSEAYYVHGLAVQTAEATAEYLHRYIRRELGLAEDQGKRYSWGYPACPDLSQHRIVFDLLPAEETLGMSLTPAYQLVPEQSTAALVVHHPAARYFSVGLSREAQLAQELRRPSEEGRR